jgi:hypothetical protein
LVPFVLATSRIRLPPLRRSCSRRCWRLLSRHFCCFCICFGCRGPVLPSYYRWSLFVGALLGLFGRALTSSLWGSRNQHSLKKNPGGLSICDSALFMTLPINILSTIGNLLLCVTTIASRSAWPASSNTLLLEEEDVEDHWYRPVSAIDRT